MDLELDGVVAGQTNPAPGITGDPADAEVRLPDGSRWSATIFTVAEVERCLMNYWTSAGEALDGSYFWCADGLIVREPGIRNMTTVLAGLHQEGNLTHMLKRLGKPS